MKTMTIPRRAVLGLVIVALGLGLWVRPMVDRATQGPQTVTVNLISDGQVVSSQTVPYP